jgi:organic radical activating enzyme
MLQEAKDPKNIEQRKANLLKALKEKRLLTLVVEPSSVCNLSCRFCDLHSGRYKDVKQYKGKMSLDTWKMLIKQIRDLGYQLEQLQIHGNGEPLLNKNIVEMVTYAKGVAKTIRLTTNGTKLTPTMTRNLIEAGVDEIWVSLDTAISEDYHLFKGSAVCDLVIKNIVSASVIANEYGKSLVIKYPIADKAKSYGVTKSFADSALIRFSVLERKFPNVHLKGMPVVVMTGGKKIYTTPCEIPFYSLFVKYDGRVSLCCADFRDDLTVGDIHTRFLSDIIDEWELTSMRLRLLDGGNSLPVLCKTCGNRTCVDLTDIKDEVRKLI